MATTLDKSGARVRDMFAQIAPKYDGMNHLLSCNFDRAWRRRAVRLLRPAPGDPILDVCTGTGDLAFEFFRQTRGECPITASDFCPEMLAIGETKKRRLGADGAVTFVEADALRLPFADNAFAIVSVAFGLRNMVDTDAGLRELARVCRPGGQVAVLEFSLPRRQPIKALYGWYFRNVLPRVGQWLARNTRSAYEYLPQSVGEFPSYEALLERMRAAGLGQGRFHAFTFGVATLYVAIKDQPPT